MANTFRYRYGPTNAVQAAVITAQGVELSDIVGLSSGNVYPVSQHSFIGGLSTAQYGFVPNFLGSAAQAKAAGSAKPGHGSGPDNRIRVNQTGVFDYDCYATTHEVGDLMGPAAASSGSAFENQKVVLVTDKTRAIGVVVGKKSSATLTKVLVSIFGSKATMRAVDAT